MLVVLVGIAGFITGVCATIYVQRRLAQPWVRVTSAPRKQGKLPPNVKRGNRPDTYRTIGRPRNMDETPSVIRQALFTRRTIRKLGDEDD